MRLGVDATKETYSANCPACGDAVDPLRVAHVAVLEDGFRYFCTEACKGLWARDRHAALDALTLEPPQVAPREAPIVALTEDVPERVCDSATDTLLVPRAPATPSTLPDSLPFRSETTTGHPALPYALGIPSGLIAVAVANLALGNALVFPFALLAVGSVVAQTLAPGRRSSGIAVFLRLLPIVGAAATALAALWLGDPHANADAAFAGAGAAVALAVHLLLAGYHLDAFAPKRTRNLGLIARGVPASALVAVLAARSDAGSAGSAGTVCDLILAACAGAYTVALVAAVDLALGEWARARTAAAERGIFYRDASAVEEAARVTLAVLCARGTVLCGEPSVALVESVGADDGPDGHDRVAVLAGGAEIASNHPIARAVVTWAEARGVSLEGVRAAVDHSGLGVTATSSGGERVTVGSRAFLVHERISVALVDARVTALEAEGHSVLLVALGERLVGLIALRNRLRSGVEAAVRRMHNAHIEPLLLSGDARDTCEALAQSLGIESVRPEVLPHERGGVVRALGDAGHVVAVIGHSRSDARALEAADLAIAVGTESTRDGDWKVSVASEELRDPVLALSLAQAARRRARLALSLGVIFQVLGVALLGAGIRLAPAVPVAAFASVLIIILTLRPGQALRAPGTFASANGARAS